MGRVKEVRDRRESYRERQDGELESKSWGSLVARGWNRRGIFILSISFTHSHLSLPVLLRPATAKLVSRRSSI